MKLPIYQVDAFADSIFTGNPAAVCPLDSWIPDDTMQQIAFENNLSETAFFVNEEGSYRIRWFTPRIEVDLCGHATLASAHVLFEHLGYDGQVIRFESNSGELTVGKEKGRLVMDFPAAKLNSVKAPAKLEKALGVPAAEVFRDSDYLYILETVEQVQKADPDFRLLKEVETRGVIITAEGDDVDFVSRFFAPAAGIEEDPVTGSAHIMLAPYWSKRLDKKILTGRQLSERGGTVYCTVKGKRVEIGGKARLYMRGEIEL